MQLFGGFQTTIDRTSIKNMTFVFPNIVRNLFTY